QWGGPHLFKGGNFRGMPEDRALFSCLDPPDPMTGKDRPRLSKHPGFDFEADREVCPIPIEK
ncbi:MAG TPA: hypothetical protein VGA09_00575, partial [Candidatus Binatia bacterium]